MWAAILICADSLVSSYLGSSRFFFLHQFLGWGLAPRAPEEPQIGRIYPRLPSDRVSPGAIPVSNDPTSGFERFPRRPSRTPHSLSCRARAHNTQYCYEVCAQGGTNTHFGTQYARECWCVDDPNLESINKYVDLPAACDFPCTGDADEFCGGSFAMNVFEISGTVTPAPVPGPIAGGDGYSYVGCRADASGDRVMGEIEETSSGMTTEVSDFALVRCETDPLLWFVSFLVDVRVP